jgi:hypothetical protein
VIKARIPLDRSTREGVRRLLRRTPIEEQVEISSGEVFLAVQEADRGWVDLYVRVANFSKRALRVEQLLVDWLGLSSEGLPLLPVVPLAGGVLLLA